MADQADDGGSNVEPAIRFREISWVRPIIIPGPVRPGHDDGDGVGPTEELQAVDSPVSTSPVLVVRTRSTIKEAISDGRIRDSLELPKYQPPNPLGIRRASQAGAAAQAAPAPDVPDAAAPTGAARAGRDESPPMVAEVFSFRVPSTMLRGDQPRRRGMAPYALNVVQPYPNPSGLKKRKHAAAVNLELPFPERLLKRQAREVSVAHMPDGSTMVTKALDEELQEEHRAAGADAAGQSDEAAARRSSLTETLVHRIRKVKANKAVVPAQEAGNDGNQQQQQVKAEAQGKGKDESAALEFIEVGESAHGKEGNMPSEPQVAAADEAEARDGGKQPVKAVKMVRNVRKTVGRYLKVTARV